MIASIPPATRNSGLIAQVHQAYLENGSMLVPHGAVRSVSTEEVAQYRKLVRTRANALAPGRVRNRCDQDRLAGQRKWDELFGSMSQQGFLPEHPVEFVIPANPKLRLHQGHHCVGVAMELGITAVPVRFRFHELEKPEPVGER